MRKFRVIVNGLAYEVEVEEISGQVNVGGNVAPVVETVKESISPPAVTSPSVSKPTSVTTAANSSSALTVNAPLPGVVLAHKVNVGDAVQKGQVLLLLEAMKMENEIVAPKDGRIAKILANVGQSVGVGEALITFES